MSRFSGLTAAGFTAAIANLFPRGFAWPRDPDAVQTKVRQALGDIVFDLHARTMTFLDIEAFPDTTDGLLAEWETARGLPDACTPSGQTEDQRRGALLARVTDTGGLSRQHYIDLALYLGLTVTIDEFRPFTCESMVEEPVYGTEWRFAWRLNVPETVTPVPFRAGMRCGARLRSWGDGRLECVIEAHNRPSRIVLFAYTGS